MSLLLVQVRSDPAALEQELRCFVRFSGLAESRWSTVNIVESEVPTEDIRDCGVLVLGGSGCHSVLDDCPFMPDLLAVTRERLQAGRPVLGSCWGHQLMALALGGEVVHDPEHSEVGTFDMELTEAGADDPWFRGLPRRFPVQLGHHDRVSVLPPGAIELARSELCPNQAFRLADRPVYGTQFHVELGREEMLERAAMYQESYLPGQDALREFDRQLRPTPQAATLLQRFLEQVGAV